MTREELLQIAKELAARLNDEQIKEILTEIGVTFCRGRQNV